MRIGVPRAVLYFRIEATRSWEHFLAWCDGRDSVDTTFRR